MDDFQNEKENEIIIEDSKPKEEKKSRPQKLSDDTGATAFFKMVFSMKFLPITLSMFAIFFGMFFRFLPYVVLDYSAVAAMFFIGFGFAFAALIICTINFVKAKKFEFNIPFVLTLISFLVMCV